MMHLTNASLVLSSSLVLIALVFSYSQRLGLEKDILLSVTRAVLQLLIVGYFLDLIFSRESFLFTSFLLVFMVFNASRTAAKRAGEIRNVKRIAFFAIACGSFLTLFILVATGALDYSSSQVVPVGGMIISNSMVALSLCFKNMTRSFKDKAREVETKLSLGADPLEASREIIRDSIRTGMTPTIDSAKTLGIVSLPGMMSGLILAGVSPVEAVKYQIMVTFMLISTTSIASFIASYLGYRSYFNSRQQLLED